MPAPAKKEYGDYIIEICPKSDVDKVMKFINEYWEKDHILSVDKGLFDWQHYNKEKQCYNFVVLKHKQTDEIYGLLGFIPTEHFDPENHDDRNIWLALWKVRDDTKMKGLGLVMREFLKEVERPWTISGIGINPEIVDLYKKFGYEVGLVKQYYMFNEKMNNFHLVINPNGQVGRKAEVNKNKTLRRITFDQFKNFKKDFSYKQPEDMFPKKTIDYFFHRFIKHPTYHYELYGIYENQSPQGLIVLRRAEYDGSYALRCVDYFGPDEALAGLGGEFQKLIQDHNAEYLDVNVYGMEDTYLEKAGLKKLDLEGEQIVPTYYEPFIKKNIKLICGYVSEKVKHYRFFRADGDQDRPRIHRSVIQ